MALNKTLQPKSSVGDRRDTSYGAGHMQEVRLQVPGTLCQRIIAAAPSWANATLSLASRVCSSMAAPRGLTNRIPFSVNSVVSLSVVDVLQDHHSERFLDMIIPAYPALPQAISRVNTNTCFIQAQKCLDESTKPHSKLKAEWLALAERWIKTAEELTN